MNFNVEEILGQILLGNRFVGIVPFSTHVVDFVIKSNLDMADMPTQEKAVRHIIIAPKKKVSEVLMEEKLLQVGFPEYEKSLLKLFNDIRNLPICDAFLKMQYEFIAKNYISAEIDIIYGLLFGFKLCDIHYYVQTRDQNTPQHSLESVLNQKIGDRERTLKEQTILCEKCTEDYLKTLVN